MEADSEIEQGEQDLKIEDTLYERTMRNVLAGCSWYTVIDEDRTIWRKNRCVYPDYLTTLMTMY